ncbi:MAG: calcium/proton exchanger [Edaphobacter sp.]|uniref:calcium/proton exchanger n=1 Tax=Edaphobacter sp. TaxID=1934404 RepID=UPI00238F1C55|nr:calcium/proton exchanger [Edaphobacter sp.]MDE1178699.1 calcium/proton exchanger [Edaphobacter sp.]
MLNAMLNWLLVFVPLTIALEFLHPEAHTWIFLSACLSVIPLAGILGHATEQIASRLGEGIGGLLNATFGNAAELIIAIAALQRGLYDVVKASLTGSIIGNVLLVFGLSAFCGGMKFKKQKFNQTAASAQAVLLTLASVGLIVPAAFHHLQNYGAHDRENRLGLDIAVVLLLTYVAHLVFSLYTHKTLFAGNGEAEAEHGEKPANLVRAVITLALATAAIAWISEILVGSVQEAAKSFGMTEVFVGVIVVAIIGNAAEHSTAVMAAMKNRMELSFGVAVGSSIQIALLVAPLLVILSHFIGPRPMDLAFSPAEVLAIFLAILITGQVAQDGETNWLEGAQLLAVYVILAIVFYFLPEVAKA